VPKCLHVATAYVFIFQRNSAHSCRLGPHDRYTMLTQLTKQNCSRQPTSIYIEN